MGIVDLEDTTYADRAVCWWSAGAASAVAAKLVLDENPDALVVYCDTSATEHPDNLRFLRDCEDWYGKDIVRLGSDRYRDIFDVFYKTGWLVGPSGARCTLELKKNVRKAFQDPDDVHVFGFTADEEKRAERFARQNLELDVCFPLIELKVPHQDCKRILQEEGIALPAMYRLGYKNNNCIGCVKGGAGYWNKIRKDFPEAFDRMAKVERDIGAAMIRLQKDGKRFPVYLDELDPDVGYYPSEPEVECGVGCNIRRIEEDE